MSNKMTESQAQYLLQLINQATGKSYRFLSHVTEDGIGKQANKVRGITKTEASAMISKWKESQ